ncbi:MAG TPA: hypothetical protein VFO82_00665 [Steroidobacteraceae bacterium]|nr:hypothetical protein [Steroidobacteraceae bacterium]
MVPPGQSVDRRRFDRKWAMALCLLAVMPLAHAGDDALERPIHTAAPVEIPHSLNLVLAELARKRNRKPDNIEGHSFLDLTPGLNPVIWPKNSDVRARLVTPEIKRTPVVGWIAENLYRSKNENGWCLEVDPGGGEYLVFYRFHPKR